MKMIPKNFIFYVIVVFFLYGIVFSIQKISYFSGVARSNPNTYLIVLSDNGFSPQTFTIRRGDTIAFTSSRA
ncbi:MAG: hypothetical protein AAB968_01790, partial [Patescibacteria group bacterium]